MTSFFEHLRIHFCALKKNAENYWRKMCAKLFFGNIFWHCRKAAEKFRRITKPYYQKIMAIVEGRNPVCVYHIVSNYARGSRDKSSPICKLTIVNYRKHLDLAFAQWWLGTAIGKGPSLSHHRHLVYPNVMPFNIFQWSEIAYNISVCLPFNPYIEGRVAFCQ